MAESVERQTQMLLSMSTLKTVIETRAQRAHEQNFIRPVAKR